MTHARVIVTGCRHWDCLDLAVEVVRRLLARHGDDLIVVHGAARGVDTAFARACRRLGVRQEPHPAEWEEYGNAAGPRRNAEMVAAGAVLAIAVHRDLAGSRGTGDCVRRCLEANIPVWLVDSADAKPRRIESTDLVPRRTEGRRP